ncbi:MAG: hypothetical protein K6U14_07200 [Firmicutes bacterium]|nr:hypothetical protein [Alicyclobacillaceae bacterium]MCL6497404.1 hypothetical protein [Bacillota bacterium]
MVTRFVMDPHPLTLPPEERVLAARWVVDTHPEETAFVTDADGRLLGLLLRDRVFQSPPHCRVMEVMVPREEIEAVDPEAPVARVKTVLARHPEWGGVPVVKGD